MDYGVWTIQALLAEVTVLQSHCEINGTEFCYSIASLVLLQKQSRT